MKKLSFLLRSSLCTLLCSFVLTAQAQTDKPSAGPFEGVLVYHSLENNSKSNIRLSQGLAYNGVRNYEIIIKGDNMHIQDLSMHLHTIVNLEKDSVYFYSDVTNRGIRYEAKQYIEKLMMQYSPDYMEVAGYMTIATSEQSVEKVKVNDYRIVKLDEQRDYMGMQNDVYRGPIVCRTITTDFEVWAAPDFEITPTIKYFLNGIEFKGLPTKYVWDSKGQVPLIGTLSSYSANELQSINPRPVADAEFLPPANCALENDDTGIKRIRITKDNTKYLKKNKMYPTDAEVVSDVQYKIDDEWDF